MKERARNLAVGVTVLLALAMLAGMILIFAGLPQAFQGGYDVRMYSESSHEVNAGDPVHVAGIRVGRVTSVTFSNPDNPGQGVTIVARIEGGTRIPVNSKAYIFTRGLGGSAYVAIVTEGPVPSPARFLATDGTAVLPVEAKGSSMIPQELLDAMKGISKLVDTFNELFAAPAAQAPSTGPASGPATPQAPPASFAVELRTSIGKLGTTLDSLNAVLGNPENKANIQVSLANLAKATAAANEAMTAIKDFATEARGTVAKATVAVQDVSDVSKETRRQIDEVAKKLIDDAEKISAVMTTLNQAVGKVNTGEGTLGKLLNDPKLYNDLVEATQQLSNTLKQFNQLLEKWKEKGVEMKLKG